MDAQQRELLLEACREAYLCLRDRNRPRVMVGGRVIHADAELAAGIRQFAATLITLVEERDALLREIQPLWEAQLSGALERLLDELEQLHTTRAARSEDYRASTALLESDLSILRALIAPLYERQHGA
jgi:hypothetical protein